MVLGLVKELTGILCIIMMLNIGSYGSLNLGLLLCVYPLQVLGAVLRDVCAGDTAGGREGFSVNDMLLFSSDTPAGSGDF